MSNQKIFDNFIDSVKNDNCIINLFKQSINNITIGSYSPDFEHSILFMRFALSDDFLNIFKREFPDKTIIDELSSHLFDLKIKAFRHACEYEFKLAKKEKRESEAENFHKMMTITDLMANPDNIKKADRHGYFQKKLLELTRKEVPDNYLSIMICNSRNGNVKLSLDLHAHMEKDRIIFSTLRTIECNLPELDNKEQILGQLMQEGKNEQGIVQRFC